MKVIKETFGHIDGQEVTQYTIINDHGFEVSCIDYGCTITKIIAPDRDGKYENVVLGYDTIEEYRNDNKFFGAVIGRVAGRIADGSFELDGQTYILAKNENNNHLHGGSKGFDKVIWKSEVIENDQEAAVTFFYLSPDGEEGYPGNLQVSVTYSVNNNNELSIRYRGQTDQKTILTLTNHAYYNLSGNAKRDILHHTLKLKSNQFAELNSKLLPTGTLLDVEGTTFDFASEREINTGAESEYPQNQLAGGGYDHPFLLNAHHDEEIVLKDAESGRMLTIETDEPSVVVYTGNGMGGGSPIRGAQDRKHLGICLETQKLPDAAHHPQFPSWVLDKGEEYTSVTTYKFGVANKE